MSETTPQPIYLSANLEISPANMGIPNDMTQNDYCTVKIIEVR
jgi:hypothetical protein